MDRSSSHGVVRQIVDTFREREELFLTLTPEGTRGEVEKWRTGFYHMAHNAEVPVVPVLFDWGRKRIVFHGPTIPSGDLDRDLPMIRGLFEGVTGRRGD